MGMAAAEHQFHILAVDDSLLDRKLIERLLRISSYQVTTVDSGMKALEFLGLEDGEQGNSLNQPSVSPKSQMLQQQQLRQKVNLIITDYCMPGMTGYDLLRKIKGCSSFRIRNIPVVILSSENVLGSPGGAEDFFIKPMRKSDVNKLRPHMLKGKPNLQNGQENTEQDHKDTHPKAEKEDHHQSQKLDSGQEQQQSQQQNNKRKSMEEGLSPDRARHRYSGLAVV